MEQRPEEGGGTAYPFGGGILNSSWAMSLRQFMKVATPNISLASFARKLHSELWNTKKNMVVIGSDVLGTRVNGFGL